MDNGLSRRKFGAALAALATAAGATSQQQQKRKNGMTKQNWGKGPNGEEVDLYTLRSAKGMEASITTYGGRIVT
ncbi:MAG TPA: hypothetical protein VHY56_07130, partial [Candidatus Binataceae bacterium]|nr:hypothetical protein [Candidatus Binataceae bacterium]